MGMGLRTGDWGIGLLNGEWEWDSGMGTGV